MLLYGFGGHGRVLADALEDLTAPVKGVFDDNSQLDCPYPFFGFYQPKIEPDVPILLGIGDNATRRELACKVKHVPGRLIHPSACFSNNASIGEGTVVLHKSIIQTGVLAGKHCIINSGAIVEHDCRLMDFVHLAPGAVLCGMVSIGEGSLIGAGAIILPGLQVGKNCVVGAGAVVNRSVPDGARVAGNPARVL